MISNGSAEPKGFRFFVGLALLVGILGVMGNALFLGLSLSHGRPANPKAVSPSLWISVLHLFQYARYLLGAVKVKKHLEWARLLLMLCAALSVCELFYNTGTSLSKGQLSPSVTNMLFFFLPLMLEGSVLVYFSKAAVRDFVKTRPGM